MVIDFHAHIFKDELAAKGLSVLLKNSGNKITPVTDMTGSSLMAYMDTAGVDLSVIQPVVTKVTQTVTVNEWAASLESDRIISFGGIYPHTDDYKRDIDYVVSLGLRGLKFHAEYQDFVLDSPEMLRIYDYALGKGLIILHHAGVDIGLPPPYKTSPRQFAAVADAMQGGFIVAAHFGGHEQWDDVEKYLVGHNIYLDTSMGFEYFCDDRFMRIARAHGTDKILFGSDSPWSAAKSELAHIDALPLSEEEKHAIKGGNAAKILGLREKNV